MNGQNNGGPAFPHPGLSDPRFKVRQGDEGMALRDWFAGQALAECLGQTWAFIAAQKKPLDESTSIYWIAALASYEAADAMLAARAMVLPGMKEGV